MNTSLALALIEVALKLAPGLVTELRLLFAKGDPQPQDWEALRAKVNKPYDAYVAEAKGQVPPS